jgi:hypothetical protein
MGLIELNGLPLPTAQLYQKTKTYQDFNMLGMIPIKVRQLKTRVGCWSMSLWEDIRAALP